MSDARIRLLIFLILGAGFTAVAGCAKPSVRANAPADGALPLLQEKFCLKCHSLDGRVIVGPSFKGLYGSRVTVKAPAGGREREVLVDEEYLRKAILQPHAEIVKGYTTIMPKHKLTPEELDLIVGYIRKLK